MTTPPSTPGINPNLLTNLLQAQGAPDLKLTQIDKYEPPRQFTDATGATWALVKDARSGMGEVPDPQAVTITDYWEHEYPGSSGKVYIYVVEGIRNPKTTRETACRVLYSWFSTVHAPNFTPQLIRPQEWLMANVYAASLSDARVSKLTALCNVQPEPQPEPAQEPTAQPQPAPLINLEEIQHDNRRTAPTGAATADNPGERRKDNRR